jgi:hypothetical protein
VDQSLFVQVSGRNGHRAAQYAEAIGQILVCQVKLCVVRAIITHQQSSRQA